MSPVTRWTNDRDGLDRFLVALNKQAPSGPLLLALSGGLDSSVMLALLVEAGLAERLRLLHVHHGLHRQADQWAAHCRQLADRFQLPLTIERVTVGRGSIEQAARAARYQALGNAAQGATVITAHHQDDQAETLLLRLVRGSGVRGLGAIRTLGQMAGLSLWRPLLAVPRATLEAWAALLALDWVDDPSNQDQQIPRNFIRHQLLPLFRQHWPNIVSSLAQSARWLQESQQLLDELAAADAASGQPQTPPVPGYPALSLAALLSLTEPRRRNLLRWWLHQQGLPAPSAQWLAELDQALHSPADRQLSLSQPPWQLRRYQRYLYLLHQDQLQPLHSEVHWQRQQGAIALGCWQLSPTPKGDACLSLAIPPGPLTLRPFKGGERLLRNGQHQQVSELWRVAGIPPWQRKQLPLVYGPQGDLLAAPAVAASDNLENVESWWLVPLQTPGSSQ